ncbi:hypothetical protein HWV62_27961 [Athelia sp. TMB]|nr:hypothetical protein HWV62_27961 [Athelia sp. TMB]
MEGYRYDGLYIVERAYMKPKEDEDEDEDDEDEDDDADADEDEDKHKRKQLLVCAFDFRVGVKFQIV